ncbi:MAG: porin family protein [Balneolaceae bacterium]|nr:porin family protein [Balneolaceae bacterium]
MKKYIILPFVFIVLFSFQAFAQLEIGASYEIRDKAPENGFGLRVQKGMLEKVPLVNLGLRAHFSYFNEENRISGSDGPTTGEITNYDFGLAAVGGVSLGLIEPYIGLGLGSETVDLNYDVSGPNEESNFYWNTFVGAKVSVIPVLKPFVEYRYSNKELSEPTISAKENDRIIFGVSLSF